MQFTSKIMQDHVQTPPRLSRREYFNNDGRMETCLRQAGQAGIICSEMCLKIVER